MNRFCLLKTTNRLNKIILNNLINSSSVIVQKLSPISYQSSDDRDLRKKQARFPKLTQQIYIQNKEVKTNDGYTLVEPLLDQSKEPHELHLIKKIGKLFGEPWWVKRAMKSLGFETNIKKEWKVIYSIKPNTNEINNNLWICKHLVKIVAVNFKNGYPSENDIGHTRLNYETGQFEIVKPIEYFNYDNISYYKQNGYNLTTDLKTNSSFPLDKAELKKALHRQKELCLLNDEYFPAVYDYKYDQDKSGVRRLKGRPDTSVKEDELTEF